MYDRPDPIEQLEAVAAFLREQAMPQLQGQAAFHARVAANMLDVVARQLKRAPDAEAGEAARLRELLGMDGSIEALNRELCLRIADGRLGLQTSRLMVHLWQVTLDKLAVDQPRYESYVRLLAGASLPADGTNTTQTKGM
ncbi:MAG: DUF6285 domain-containing protein [Burkholderiaceae bacterium]